MHLLIEQFRTLVAADADADHVDLARDAFIQGREQVAQPAAGEDLEGMHFRLGRAACDALARARHSGDQPGAVCAVTQYVVGPAIVAASALAWSALARAALALATREVLAVDDMAQRRKGIVAARIDDADANSSAGQATGRIDPHEALAPLDHALAKLAGEIWKCLRQWPQFDRGGAALVQLGSQDEPLPIIRLRPDIECLHRLSPAAEQAEPRGTGLVSDGLDGKSWPVDDHRRPGERLIALADDAQREFAGDRRERKDSSPAAGRTHRRRQAVGEAERPVVLDDDLRLGGGLQAFRLPLRLARHHDLLRRLGIAGERLHAGRLHSGDDLDALLSAEIVDDRVDGLRLAARHCRTEPPDSD